MRLRIMIPPIPKGRGRVDPRRMRVYTPKRTREYMATIRDQVLLSLGDVALPYFEKGLPLRVDVDFVLKRPQNVSIKKHGKGLVWSPKRPDRDNLDKAVLDALTGVLWYDDAQIVTGRIRTLYAEVGGPPRVCMSVEPAGDVPVVLCDSWASEVWEEEED